MSAKTIAERIAELGLLLPETISKMGDEPSSPDVLWIECGQKRAVRDAAKRLGLDASRADHMALMLTLLASAYVGPPATRWTSPAQAQLLMQYLRLREQNPSLNDGELYNLISKRRRYANDKPATIGRAVRNAFDPMKNLLLRDVLAMMPNATELVNKRRKRKRLPDWRTMTSHFDELKANR